ncbi:MAG: ATP-dependent Clp protease adaptor ClpS [Paludibacteraceae bacterium]|nr:ATP-dependent Clp protease adaptor ClpS [Paludibacteraceae bacterium]
MAQEQTGIRERQRVDLREPRRYKVVMHNDDFTTMDFVVMVLRTVFAKSDADAEAIMLGIHKQGSAVVGIYSLDVAKTKVQKATQMARDNNFPLKVTYSPEN